MAGGMKAWVCKYSVNPYFIVIFLLLSNAYFCGLMNFYCLFVGLLDFAPTYAPERAHSVYCTRRYIFVDYISYFICCTMLGMLLSCPVYEEI